MPLITNFTSLGLAAGRMEISPALRSAVTSLMGATGDHNRLAIRALDRGDLPAAEGHALSSLRSMGEARGVATGWGSAATEDVKRANDLLFSQAENEAQAVFTGITAGADQPIQWARESSVDLYFTLADLRTQTVLKRPVPT